MNRESHDLTILGIDVDENPPPDLSTDVEPGWILDDFQDVALRIYLVEQRLAQKPFEVDDLFALVTVVSE